VGEAVRIRGSRWARATVIALAAGSLTISGVLVSPAAQAAPRDLNAVRVQVQDLQAKAEAATEKYNSARNELNDVQQQLSGLRDKVKRERGQLQQILSSVDDLARNTYTSGGLDTSLQVLLAENPSEFLAQAAALDQVAQAQASSLRRTQTARLRLAQSEAAVQDKEAIAKKYRDQMASSKKEADSRLSEAKKVLASLEAAERRRLAAIEARERAASAAAAAAARRSLSRYGASSAGGGVPAVSGRASAAVSYALSKVGYRYVAAAAGPSSFDCSGLTMSAWRQAGVSLPHYSYSQYSSTRRISLSEARPGDLVFFFGGGVHHVGMYIGNGKMVHAANPSAGVRIDAVLGPWYNRYFSGVGRVVG
jgi:cell wall-associated NlpC family hydrolase